MSDARTSQRHSLCNRGLEFGCPALLGGPVESGLPALQNGAVGAQREVRQRENKVKCRLVAWTERGARGASQAEADLDEQGTHTVASLGTLSWTQQ